mgnify:CR=1 FL=1
MAGGVRTGSVFYKEEIHRPVAPYMDQVKTLEMEAFALFCNTKALGKRAA